MTTETATIAKKETKVIIKKPSMFKVIFENDNATPMEFVVEVLMKIYHHDQASATHIMTEIHEKGKGVAGLYTYEIAEQKAGETVTSARMNGFPLAVTIEVE